MLIHSLELENMRQFSVLLALLIFYDKFSREFLTSFVLIGLGIL